MATKIEQFISDFHSGEPMPLTFDQIPRQYEGQLPIYSFEELKNRMHNKELSIRCVDSLGNEALFNSLASRTMKLLKPSCFIAVLVLLWKACSLGFTDSAWYFLLLLGAPVFAYLFCRIHQKVIVDASLDSERGFCFLYMTGMIGVFVKKSRYGWHWITTEDTRVGYKEYNKRVVGKHKDVLDSLKAK